MKKLTVVETKTLAELMRRAIRHRQFALHVASPYSDDQWKRDGWDFNDRHDGNAVTSSAWPVETSEELGGRIGKPQVGVYVDNDCLDALTGPAHPFVLDEWDCRMIHYLKQTDAPSIAGLVAIWAERCAIETKYVRICFIVERMALIVEELGIKGEFLDARSSLGQLIYNADTINQVKFGMKGPLGHWENWLRVLSSVLMLAKVKDLPGYAEWVDGKDEGGRMKDEWKAPNKRRDSCKRRKVSQ